MSGVSKSLRADSPAAHAGVARRLENGLLWLTLDRPARRNAIDRAMATELLEALEAAALDEVVLGIVITGSGTAFSAGADLGTFLPDADPRARRFESGRLTALIELIERIEKPVLAAINGVATGMGLQLALACDLRVAAESARFTFAEGRINLVAAHGGIVRLVKLVGLARARDLLLSSRPVSSADAHRLGLVTDVVPDDQLPAAVEALARDALARAPQSYGLTKRLLWLAASADVASGLIAEGIAQSLLMQSDDHREGLAAIRERRPPSFTGR